MQDSIIFEGKTLDKALQTASEKLNENKNNLNYEILSSASKGFLGFFSKDAKIKVYLEDKKNCSKAVTSLIDETFNKDNGKNKNKEKKFEKPFFTDKTKNPKQLTKQNEKTNFEKDENIYSEELILLGKETIEKILNFILQEEYSVNFSEKNKKVFYNIKTKETELVIGKEGHTIEALRYIVEKRLSKKTERKVRVFLDVKGYLSNKKVKLERLALDLARKSKQKNKTFTMKKLNSTDRKIVHMFLKNDKNIKTQSVGDGYYKKLIIKPAKNKNNFDG